MNLGPFLRWFLFCPSWFDRYKIDTTMYISYRRGRWWFPTLESPLDKVWCPSPPHTPCLYTFIFTFRRMWDTFIHFTRMYLYTTNMSHHIQAGISKRSTCLDNMYSKKVAFGRYKEETTYENIVVSSCMTIFTQKMAPAAPIATTTTKQWHNQLMHCLNDQSLD